MIARNRLAGFGSRTIPRGGRDTFQGGMGRGTVGAGQPNVRGQGIMQSFLGANPTGGFGTRVNKGAPGPTDSNRFSPLAGGRVNKGAPGPTDQNRRPPIGGPRGGKGGGVGGGRQNILKKLGMPLDPLFEGDRRQWKDAYSAAMVAAKNAYQTGGAALDEQGMLANRGLDEDMSSRGLFGSGIERRGERLIGNDTARGKMDLLSQFTGSKSDALMDRRRSVQEALMQLARRQQSNRYLPIPKRNGARKGRKPGGRR